ncbi:hypothetical protein E2C01_072659 [Portunus trituberculatus]|uniref:Uncharacterized protein n=1 Tax=Portunus trituberculatus TaxID=210409 RepID=A0A5B7I9I9_PORTR|nr:hypothetical protein [Portunus trituberculatus]
MGEVRRCLADVECMTYVPSHHTDMSVQEITSTVTWRSTISLKDFHACQFTQGNTQTQQPQCSSRADLLQLAHIL